LNILKSYCFSNKKYIDILRIALMADKVFEFIDSNKSRFLDELKTLLKIPSVSADSKYKQDVIGCAKWLVNHLAGLGFEAQLV